VEVAGILVGLIIGATVGVWYFTANRRFSVRVLGYDPIAPRSTGDVVTNAPDETSRILSAFRSPSEDAETERERILATRRFVVFVAYLPVFVLLPLVFDVTAAALIAVRAAVVGIVIVLTAVGLVVHRSVAVARIAYSYGNGGSLRGGELASAIAGVVVGLLVLCDVAVLAR